MAEEGLKIAVLCPGFGRVTRGVEVFTEGLIRRLLALHPGWLVDIYCRGPNAELAAGLRQIHVPALDRDGRAATLYAQIGHRLGVFLRTRIDAECLSFTVALAPRLLSKRYDLVFNQAGPFAGRLLQLKRRLEGTPFIHKTASGYGELEALMARQRPDAIVATSPFVKEWLGHIGGGLKVECIPNAVECSTFRPYSPKELEAARNGYAIFRLERPIVLFVGAMEPMKRPELLISALRRVPEASLVMVGSGRLSKRIRDLGAAHMKNRFLLVPRVPPEEMAIYYNACDLFTLPSEEPFGIVFLEAMACNKPVLGHHSPVQEWIFGDAGMTCDCTNVNEYADTIRHLLSADLDGRPLERSRKFDWSEVLPRYEGLLVRVASNHRRWQWKQKFP